MKIQVKVTQTETFTDAQGTRQVCKGRLIILPKEVRDFAKERHGILKYFIVSDTEKMKIGDKALVSGEVYDINTDVQATLCNNGNQKKILAFIQDLSTKQVSAILNNKLQHGDEVLIECEETGYPVIGGNRIGDKSYVQFTGYQIKFDKKNHIKLFPVEIPIFTLQDIEESIEFGLQYAFSQQHVVQYQKDKNGFIQELITNAKKNKRNPIKK